MVGIVRAPAAVGTILAGVSSAREKARNVARELRATFAFEDETVWLMPD